MSAEISEFFAKAEIEKIARETNFVQRKSALGGAEFLDLLVFTRFNQLDLSLNDMASILASRHGINISKQAVDERFNGFSICFFKGLLDKLLKQELASLPTREKLLEGYGMVRIKDSTCFQLPACLSGAYPGSGGSGSPASVRIQFEYDLKSGQVIDLSIHPFNVQDIENAQLPVYDNCNNDVFVRDLGYICINSLQQIEQNNNFYINRLQSGVSVWYLKNGIKTKLDFVELLGKMKKHGINRFEKQVWIGQKKDFKTRLVIFLVPQDKVDERVRRINKEAKKKGRKVNKENLARIGLNLFITNIPCEEMLPQEIWEIYRLRWQVELIFKVWKSIGEIHQVKKLKKERFESFLLARLIWIMINWKIIWELGNHYWKEKRDVLSIMKVFKHLAELSHSIRDAIIEKGKNLDRLLYTLFKICPKYFLLEKRKGKLSMIDILMAQTLSKC